MAWPGSRNRFFPSIREINYVFEKIFCRICSILVLLLLLPVVGSGADCAQASVENLDEMIARKARHASAAWDAKYLEANELGRFIWQPETLCYYDVTTGREVWRLTSTNSKENYIRNIGQAQWSADGKRLAFISSRATNAFNCYSSSYGWEYIKPWFIVRTDGLFLRPTQDGPSLTENNHHYYFYWNPQVPDVYYMFGRRYGMDWKDLYKATVSDTEIEYRKILSFPSEMPGSDVCLAGISPDGRYVFGSPWGLVWFCPAHVAEDSDLDIYGSNIAKADFPRFLIENGGYWGGEGRNLDTYWGETETIWNGFHAVGWFTGVGDKLWYHFQVPTGAAKWRMKMTGSGTDGGPSHVQDRVPPYSWGGELEPVNTFHYSLNDTDPWCNPGDGVDPPDGTDCPAYFSHPARDRWGRFVVYSRSTLLAGDPIGSSIWDIENHVQIVKTYGGLAQHHCWMAWSDWSVSSRGYDRDLGYLNDRIYAQNYHDFETQVTLCYTHTRYNDDGVVGGDYEALVRPTQSPDGTKVAWHSTFLNNAHTTSNWRANHNYEVGDLVRATDIDGYYYEVTETEADGTSGTEVPLWGPTVVDNEVTWTRKGANDEKPDLFWVVAYYPYPPEITGALKIESRVRIAFDFRQNTDHPRTYTARGWPDEEKDPPPLPKETEGFRLWVSSDGSEWTPSPAKSRLGTDRSRTDWYCDVSQEAGTTRYYGVTSVEHSGLESHTLSNVWKVTLDENGNITEQVQDVPYPVHPGGVSRFYTQKPFGPINVTYGHKKAAPVDKDGQYTIEWDEPADTTMIRYYNIYAEDGTVPAMEQSNRIASIARGWCQDEKCRWVDVFGNPDGTTRYRVTSVDFQGNESLGKEFAPVSPKNLQVIQE